MYIRNVSVDKKMHYLSIHIFLKNGGDNEEMLRGKNKKENSKSEQEWSCSSSESSLDNQFSGPIPVSFSALSALRFLNLSNNVFNQTFPSQLARLSNLEVLDLYNNNMTGPLPLAVASMPLLRHLHLGGNFFSGQIPPGNGELPPPPFFFRPTLCS